jgi:hypothetical protein
VAAAVYALCALSSLIVAVLLARGYLRTRTRLLFWAAVCFAGFFVNNALLLVDVAVPMEDLSVWRTVPALIGVGALLYGLVWETSA